MRSPLGTPGRRLVSLLTASTFIVLSVTGVLAFVRPFSIGIIGLHALTGFVFMVLIGLHVLNNRRPLGAYLRSRTVWITTAATVAITVLFWWQPPPVKSVLRLSGNLGPAMERFAMNEDALVFDYVPSPDYKMKLTVETGPGFRADPPPQVAIWLENQGAYHIKTLLAPDRPEHLPYWSFKRAGWEKARQEAAEEANVDAVSEPTPNGSFDPADYVVPAESGEPLPYSLLLEIRPTEPDGSPDGLPSLVYAVEIDNRLPRTFQLLQLVGYPERDEESGEWSLYYVDERFEAMLDLLDSALLTIDRGE